MSLRLIARRPILTLVLLGVMVMSGPTFAQHASEEPKAPSGQPAATTPQTDTQPMATGQTGGVGGPAGSPLQGSGAASTPEPQAPAEPAPAEPAPAQPGLPELPDLSKQMPPAGAKLSRTLSLLADSTPERRNRVKVLFYGQSITMQAWWKTVVDELKARFPNAEIIAENRAIGGFAVPLLSRPAEHDVYPFYPDLIIFHVYGGDPDYEDLIREFRSRTTADVLVQSDHWVTGQSNEWHDKHSWQWLPALSRHYGLEYCDVRSGWVKHLRDNDLRADSLLSDGVHLNEKGEALMAAVVLGNLKRPTNVFEDVSVSESVTDVAIGETIAFDEKGVLRVAFQGNRIDLIAAASPGGRPLEIWIDGKRPSEHRWAYAITRPSGAFGVGWPAITRVSSNVVPAVEDWTLTVTKADDASKDVDFTVRGSVTGDDGGGNSLSPFVSTSGRVVIDPTDWHTSFSREFTGKPMPAGFEVKWSIVRQALDTYEPTDAADPTLENVVTIAQDMPNVRHTLELRASGEVPKILALRVYRPPVTSITPRLGQVE